MERFEVRAPVSDKPLIREIARRLAEGDAELRRELERDLAPEQKLEPTRGAIWRAFRNSPLVGADIDLERRPFSVRDIDL